MSLVGKIHCSCQEREIQLPKTNLQCGLVSVKYPKAHHMTLRGRLPEEQAVFV